MGNCKNKLKKKIKGKQREFKKENKNKQKIFFVFDNPLSENAQTKVIFVVHKIDVDK